MRTATTPSPATDHPRSRGVYVVGSAVAALGHGIIPARAGFTRGPPSSASSSPRIIPARAGFTARRSRSRFRPRDHPRSRGVYIEDNARINSIVGSSPLARGLHRRRGSGPGPSRDHPRSRGVYPARPAAGTSTAGSSPLARGLQRPPRPRGMLRRIIPARAGFTRLVGAARVLLGDHPRSRGVYAALNPAGRTKSGSSPLARGLPVHTTNADGWIGIIPARAGFTHMAVHLAEVAADHPRSRGVYLALITGSRS